MKQQLKKKFSLCTAVGAVLIATSGGALAGTQGVSILNIVNLAFTDGSGTSGTPGTTLTVGGGGITSASGDTDLSSSASLGDTQTSDDPPSQSFSAETAVSACAEVGSSDCSTTTTPPYPNPLPTQPDGTANRAIGEADIDDGSVLDTGGATTASTSTRAETELNTDSQTNPRASATGSANLDMIIDPGSLTSLTAEFDAELFMSAYNDIGSDIGTQSTVTSNWSIVLEDRDTGQQAIWTPDDSLDGCSFVGTGSLGCSDESDPFSLNQTWARVAPSANGTGFSESTVGTNERFSLTFTGLGNTSGYRIFVSQMSTSDSQVVPEPATLALFSGGLLGLGAMVRRHRSKESEPA